MLLTIQNGVTVVAVEELEGKALSNFGFFEKKMKNYPRTRSDSSNVPYQ